VRGPRRRFSGYTQSPVIDFPELISSPPSHPWVSHGNPSPPGDGQIKKVQCRFLKPKVPRDFRDIEKNWLLEIK
jgi:hypothetical protein